MNNTLKNLYIRALGFKLNASFIFKPNQTSKQVFNLFCTPQKGKFKRLPLCFKEADNGFKPVAGHNLQTYHWPGKGKHILLLHGWQSNSSRWEGLIKKLQMRGYEITAIDLPAHGGSSGRFLNLNLISKTIEMGINSFTPDVIVAHSLAASGVVFSNWKKLLPADLQLILLAPPAQLSVLLENFRAILRLSPKIIKSLDPLIVDELGLLPEDCSIPEFSKKLSQKGLLLHDSDDHIVNLSASKKLFEHWKNACFKITSHAGHSLNNEACQKTIVNFVENEAL